MHARHAFGTLDDILAEVGRPKALREPWIQTSLCLLLETGMRSACAPGVDKGGQTDMTPQLWIGFGFLTALVIFLIVSFFVAPKLTDDQRRTMKFLTALCAGVAGGFLAGASVFEGTWTTPTSKIALSGTAGFALFFAVWFFYPKVFTIADAISISIPNGWSFRDATDTVVSGASAVADYQGFTKKELTSPMKSTKIETKTVTDALLMLRLLPETPGAIREYDVTQDGSVYRLKVKG